jgi:hypothetical protein
MQVQFLHDQVGQNKEFELEIQQPFYVSQLHEASEDYHHIVGPYIVVLRLE